MSELINKNDNRAAIRWKLLTGASALALTACVSSSGLARAEDAGQSQFWIELGGQLSRLQDGQEIFAPAFPGSPPRPAIFSAPGRVERPPLYGFDEFGSLSFEPADSNWIFSASVRYGRTAAKRDVQQQTNPHYYPKYIGGIPYTVNPAAQKFAQTKSSNSEKYEVLDFEAGREVGLGLLGSKDATSIISAGVRFAQFQSKSNISIKTDPDWHVNYVYFPTFGMYISFGQAFHSNLASMTAQRSFHGIGPTLSWKASEPLAGNVQDGALMLDWSVNAAVLFGRQRTRTHHQSTVKLFSKYDFPVVGSYPVIAHTVSQYPGVPHNRSRNVTVPNVGGSVGVSYKYANAKLSFGYRADFFFNAIDGGIDAAKKEDRGFYGPFASISIGLGD